MVKKISIDVGERQNGRLRANSVINCEYNSSEILQALDNIENRYSELEENDFKSPYYQEDCISKVEEAIKKIQSGNYAVKNKKRFR